MNETIKLLEANRTNIVTILANYPLNFDIDTMLVQYLRLTDTIIENVKNLTNKES